LSSLYLQLHRKKRVLGGETLEFFYFAAAHREEYFG
jgi:hypothetical protein